MPHDLLCPGRRLDVGRPRRLSAYSRTARSDENQPMRAVLRMLARHHAALAVQRVDRALRLPIGVEIGRDHEVVVVEQRLDERADSGPARRARTRRPRCVVIASASRGEASTASRPVKRGCRRCSTSLGGQAEDEDVVGADPVANLDVGAVERADGQRAVERKLHVAGAGGLHAGGRDLLRQVGRRDDRPREADVVVRQERDLEPVADRRSRR